MIVTRISVEAPARPPTHVALHHMPTETCEAKLGKIGRGELEGRMRSNGENHPLLPRMRSVALSPRAK